jgi:uncharacterized coiled-coil protein SlyX
VTELEALIKALSDRVARLEARLDERDRQSRELAEKLRELRDAW